MLFAGVPQLMHGCDTYAVVFLMCYTRSWHKSWWKPEVDVLWWNGMVPACPSLSPCCCTLTLLRMRLVYIPILWRVTVPAEQHNKKSAGPLMSLPSYLSAIGIYECNFCLAQALRWEMLAWEHRAECCCNVQARGLGWEPTVVFAAWTGMFLQWCSCLWDTIQMLGR